MSSGYPSAAALRLWLNSPEEFREILHQQHPHGGEREGFLRAIDNFRNKHQASLELFRHGCFGSVDEFCKLAGPQFPAEVQDLKRMLRVALAIVNPEQSFAKSSYYSFVQRLFSSDGWTPRSDVSVLSYNYDTYLDHLLNRAYATRFRAHHRQPLNFQPPLTGFCTEHSDFEGNGFVYLKLHGSISSPIRKPQDAGMLTHEELFDGNEDARLNAILRTIDAPVPLAFPWEVDEARKRDKTKQYCWNVPLLIPNGKGAETSMHEHFYDVWRRARQEVSRATKISFVSISFHSFLESGLKDLFFDREEGAIDVISANDADRHPPNTAGWPLTPAGKLQQFFSAYRPGIRFKHGEVRRVGDFDTFINTEL